MIGSCSGVSSSQHSQVPIFFFQRRNSIRITASSLWFHMNFRLTASQIINIRSRRRVRLLWSMHSSFEELFALIQKLQPHQVVPTTHILGVEDDNSERAAIVAAMTASITSTPRPSDTPPDMRALFPAEITHSCPSNSRPSKVVHNLSMIDIGDEPDVTSCVTTTHHVPNGHAYDIPNVPDCDVPDSHQVPDDCISEHSQTDSLFDLTEQDQHLRISKSTNMNN